MTEDQTVQQPLWTKDFINVTVVNFLMYMVHFALFVTVTSYTIHEFHTSESLGGLAAGIFIIGMLFGRLVAGRFIDSVQLKYMLIFGVIFSFIAVVLYYVAVSLLLLYIVRFLHGLAFGVGSNATSSMASKVVPAERKGEGIGYYSLSNILASAIGPFVGILISQQANFQQIFLFGLIFIVIAFILTLFIKRIPIARPTEDEQLAKPKGWRAYLQPEALPISIVIFIIGICYSSILSYIKSFAETMDLVTASSLFFICYAVISFVSRPFTGKIFDHKGPNYIIFPTFILFALGLLTLSGAMNTWLFMLAAIFVGIGYGTLVPSSQTLAIQQSPADKMGLATSTFFICLDLGSGIGPFVLGFVISAIGYRALYISIAVVVLLAMVLYYFVQKRYKHLNTNVSS
ncbi:MFS transporter [Staphylococcus sp. SQ8-PEA]|uniref:MFS transporter n=1 Tax=Staphylococcus marylandisciuri TaxID=2981529 RepID=A0ABT2QQK5_9STAP|nr:MFS transporter [Staphylococcus marylandisciuri]MCU5746251.1 MFS transporter [Staphylococcus marylandisciuri]